MPMISTIILVTIHLLIAFAINMGLKKYGIVTDVEFMLIYFVLLALKWRSVVDKLYYSLILNPVNTSHELLIEGLKRRKEYVEKYQRKQFGKETNSSTKSSK